jgi:hypothetical protein
MSGDSIAEAQAAVFSAMAALRAVARSGHGKSKFDVLRFHAILWRQSDYDYLALL